MKRTRTRFYPSTYNLSPFRGLGGILMLLLPLFFSCRPLHYSERRAQLDSLQRANQADAVFRSDSLQRILVDYFDRHGTPDDRMLAHYILGRAYYDMGETPLALHHYHEAIESADTTDKDCDFMQLGRIHGQAGDLLLKQNAPREAFSELERAYDCSLRSKDTLTALACLTKKSSVYERLNMLDSAVIVSRRASDLYDSLGYSELSAICVGNIIDIYIRDNQLDVARQLIERYESVSSLYDERGDICQRRIIYYYTKGLYYLGLHKTDSAFICFESLRKRASKTNHLECAYHGLALCYQQQEKTDSSAKYALLAYNLNDSCHREKMTDTYQQNQALYRYSRLQNQAEKESRHARVLKDTLFIVTICILVLTLLLLKKTYDVRNRKKEVRRKEEELTKSYLRLSELVKQQERLEELQSAQNIENRQLRHNVEELKKDYDKQLTEMERTNKEQTSIMQNKDSALLEILYEKRLEIESMKGQILKLERQLGKTRNTDADSQLLDSRIINDVKEQLKHSPHCLSEKQWVEMNGLFEDALPTLYEYIRNVYPDIRKEELMVVFFTRCFFLPYQISILTGKKISAVSMIKKRLNIKLFNDKDGGTKAFDDYIRNF